MTFLDKTSSNRGFRIPLHSDTATMPSSEMREAIANAPLGDEQRREDPTVARLEETIAEILGKEAAVFLPSATMANTIAVRLHCRQGEEAIVHAAAHMMNWEAGAFSAMCGVAPRPLGDVSGVKDRGILDPWEVRSAIRGVDFHNPPSTLILLENTTNLSGGHPWSLTELDALANVARRAEISGVTDAPDRAQKGIATHVDGSRLFNAAVALVQDAIARESDAPELAPYRAAAAGCDQPNPATLAVHLMAKRIVRDIDTVTICYSKGLGAPVGATLAGPRYLIERARRLKHQFGGAMRQAGVIAAGALYGLENNLAGLADDHRRAWRLAEGLHEIDGLEISPENVRTNILIVRVTNRAMTAAEFAGALQARGVGAYGRGETFRLVTHRDVDDAMIEETIAIAREIAEA